MIARSWRGKATPDKAADYQHHFLTNVVPHIAAIPGHRAPELLRREVTGQVEFTAVTFWKSIDSSRPSAGADQTVSVIEPEGGRPCRRLTTMLLTTRWCSCNTNWTQRLVSFNLAM